MFSLFRTTFDEWNKDHAPRLGAALAYYMVFSLGPLLLIVISLVGLIWGRAAAEDQLLGQLRDVVGPDAAAFVQSAIAGAGRSNQSLLGSFIGCGTLVLGAIGVFLQLQDALNAIWQVAPRPNSGWLTMVRTRLLSFAMVLVIGLLLLVSLIAQVAIEAAFTYLASLVPYSASVVRGIDFFVSLAFITILFAMIFKYLPDAAIRWRDVWAGALLTSLLFLIGRFVLGLYLARAAPTSTYGAAGSVIIFMIWMYYSAQILFFGAEFAKVYATRHGREIEPAPNAERVAQVEG